MPGTSVSDLPTTATAVDAPALLPLPVGRPQAPALVRGKLYIKTHGLSLIHI